MRSVRRRLTVLLPILALAYVSFMPSGLGAGLEPPAAVAPSVERHVEEALEFLRSRRTGIPVEQQRDIAAAIVREARRAGLAPAMLLALIHVESSGRVRARSRVGALGLMQIMPATGEAMAEKIGLEWHGPETLFDPVANVQLGTAYLAELIERYDDIGVALAAYNWGPGNIARFARRGEAIPAGYTTKVMRAVVEI